MDEAIGSFTIHGGSIEFKGRHFMFYHDGRLPNGGGFRRSTCVEEFTRGADGSIPHIDFTKGNIYVPVCNLNPFTRVEAETMADSYGLKTDRQAGRDHWLTRIYNGSWQRLRAVDFGTGAAKVTARVRGKAGGTIEMIVDGKTIAVLDVDKNAGWHMVSAPVEGVKGVHDLMILYRGGDEELFDFDWWKMIPYL